MSNKPYDPQPVEKKWIDFWEKKKIFHADAKSKKPPFCVILPPPNITGALHMGHALVNTLQDVSVRYKKLQGFEVLWIPGSDHAGISTQTMVEKDLFNKTQKRKCDFSREEFVKHIWTWKEKHETIILNQLKKIGVALDWTRYLFTLDDASTKAVQTMFAKMFNDGLIYRGLYLVNWDPVLQTAIADDEVEHEDQESFLWHIRYPVKDTKEHIVIATTRPETLLGDVAVAVSPKDTRYKKFIGKSLSLPLTDRLIPVIEDNYVDPEFGTGAVKITPAHDFNDYEIGKRHSLSMINIMNPDGTIVETIKPYAGLSMQEARKQVIKDLEKQNLLEKIEPHTNRIGLSYRTKAVIEPYLSKQWFIRMESFKDKLIQAVREKDVEIIPSYWEKTYFHWIDNLRDWCISRQLWWGHRIPVWIHKDDPEKMICYVGDGIPPEVQKNPDLWRQEEDVLDTWFSSGIWPLTTLGWPEKTPDLEKFYPTSLLITGYDILFFWVARMILMGTYATGKVPFHKTFVHGLIFGKSYWRQQNDQIFYVSQDERMEYEEGAPVPSDVFSRWEKMSKTKGNIVDPLHIIKEFGADAMRLTLASSINNTKQIDLDYSRFSEYKHFVNKLWNASKFIFSHTEKKKNLSIQKSLLTLEDYWIITRLSETIDSVQTSYDNLQYADALQHIYRFFWDEFCAYYLELSKPYVFGKLGEESVQDNKRSILQTVLENALILLHPIAPFVTEEIFSFLQKGSIMENSFPSSELFINNTQKKELFTSLLEVIRNIRNIRSTMNIAPGVATDVIFFGEKDDSLLQTINQHQDILHTLVPISQISFSAEKDTSNHSTAQVQNISICIPIPKMYLEKEKNRLEKERIKLDGQILSLQKKLHNPQFIEKAPEEIRTKTKSNLDKLLQQKQNIEDKLLELHN